jgi:hypothetical protein
MAFSGTPRSGLIVVVFSEWQGKFFRAKLTDLIAGAVRHQADDSFPTQSKSLQEMLTSIRSVTGRNSRRLFANYGQGKKER